MLAQRQDFRLFWHRGVQWRSATETLAEGQLLTVERPAGSSLATSVVDPKRLGSAGSE
jgi:hypothetical protein